ncbi:angiopoietin-like protein 8 isoform X1 [Zootoca vivipara]|uniref:angiopoietin-like protein 8 isoform X1 n=2 Tax=Zootoca vivipara TaxID=8524 RepID=UPI00293C0C35|nr:angiopoietin-like protein 8 isoform X1 [Zootoca vivipara]
MLTFLFPSILLPCAAMLAPILTGPQQPAAPQDVNILFYGVLQFSSTLSDFYDSTTRKLDKIRRSSDFYERGLEVLRRQTQRAQQKQKEIGEIVEGLEDESLARRQQAHSNKEALQKMLAGQQDLVRQVKALEGMLAIVEERGFQNKGWEFSALKAHMQQQNLTIWSLLRATQQQQQQLARQTEQLLWIQRLARQAVLLGDVS